MYVKNSCQARVSIFPEQRIKVQLPVCSPDLDHLTHYLVSANIALHGRVVVRFEKIEGSTIVRLRMYEPVDIKIAWFAIYNHIAYMNILVAVLNDQKIPLSD